jgi:AICAR transformylase/IMP cyclohydrolase PurH
MSKVKISITNSYGKKITFIPKHALTIKQLFGSKDDIGGTSMFRTEINNGQNVLLIISAPDYVSEAILPDLLEKIVKLIKS